MVSFRVDFGDGRVSMAEDDLRRLEAEFSPDLSRPLMPYLFGDQRFDLSHSLTAAALASFYFQTRHW